MNQTKPMRCRNKRLCAGIAVLAVIAMLLTACRNDSAVPASTETVYTMSVMTVTTSVTTTSASATTTTTVTTTVTTTTTTTTVPTTTTTTVPTTSPTHIPTSPILSDGVTPAVWKANCNEYITLRPSPNSSDAIITIPAGDTMILLDWDGLYAKVSYYGLTGYVPAYYVAPVDGIVGLSVVPVTNVYSYEQMCADIDTLCAQFPSVCRRDSIGTSELGRDIPVLKLGAESASRHVLIQGAIHGLEHTTAWVMMAMANSYVSRDALPADVCFHFIPMSNPDGVVLAQTGVLTDTQRAIYASDLAANHTQKDEAAYASQWKANGLGIDLNRNFDAEWTPINSRAAPSSERYKGKTPFSAAESRALRDYTLSRSFDATVSYHATGSILYYEFGTAQPVNDLSYDLAKAVYNVSGYPPVKNSVSTNVEGGGYKDWAMEALGIPSLTIEIGCEDTPLAYQELYNVLYRNMPVLNTVAQWVKSH